MHNGTARVISLVVGLLLQLLLSGCGCGDPTEPQPAGWPISNDVFTTAQQQILPVALPTDTPVINPADVPLYATFGYSAWQKGPGLPYVKRAELAPAYNGAPNASRLLSFFTMTDIHITDKESPAQPINPGWSAEPGQSKVGGTTVNMSSSYSPIILSTTQVLDAAVQTINALHEHSPCDFVISLGDDINNHQYNELRWFIDVLDGQVITPSSGAHAGADTIDYQQPYKAAGLDPALPWYQAIGNHDQYWSGVAYETQSLQDAHVGSDIINMCNNPMDPNCINETGYYMGVVDGSTIYGDVIGAGAQEFFPVPPTVVPDDDRHSLSTSDSASLNWMSEFFNTTSNPVGHGFNQANLDNDFACYTFEPKSDIPIKVIVLDDTNKRNDALASPVYYGMGGLDQTRLDWLTSELQKGQNENKLMIIAAHIPIKPQTSLTNTAATNGFYDSDFEDSLLATLHNYPNLILWIAGHRHVNVVTPLPSADTVNHPEQSFWEVETASLRDFPQQLRSFDIRRNSDNTISILITNVDTAVVEDSPAAKSRGYAIGVTRVFGATPTALADTSSQAYNAELVKQLTPAMQTIIANAGTPLSGSGD